MSGERFFFIELVLGHGIVLGWAIWELISLRRSQKRDREPGAERARQAEEQNGRDPGR